MFAQERQDAIIQIVKEKKVTSVKELKELLFYSTATINRDLNVLAKENLITRSYGEIRASSTINSPLHSRYDVMRNEKDKIGHLASKLINDGDIIFLDASTTTQAMLPYLLKFKKITVITNNLAAVSLLSTHKIKVICLGGEVVESPYFLGSEDTSDIASRYHAHKLFFATDGLTDDGKIINNMLRNLYHTMLNNSDKKYLLIDRSKMGAVSNIYLCSLNNIDAVISDIDMPANIKKKYPKTKFISVEASKKANSD